MSPPTNVETLSKLGKKIRSSKPQPTKRPAPRIHSNLLVIGSGEAFDAQLGNTSYLLTGQTQILFDCGYQIPERLWRKNLHQRLDAVCFTHLHADHSFGIVPLLVRYWEEGRTQELALIGPRGTKNFVTRLLQLGYPGVGPKLKFSLKFLELSEKSSLRWGGLTFAAARTNHSVLNYTIRVDGFAQGFSFSISGDGQTTEESLRLIEGVDLHLQEIYSLQASSPFHADLKSFVRFMETSSIGKIGVAHLSRNEKPKIVRHITKLSSQDSRWNLLRPGTQLKLRKQTQRG